MYGPIYRSYMIRLWWEDPNQPPRVLVKSVGGDITMRFATLDEFFDFLKEQPLLGPPIPAPANDEGSADQSTAAQFNIDSKDK